MSTQELETQLPARSLGEILNETFVVYGRHFRQFAGVAAVVQVPATLLALIPGDGVVDYIAVNIVLLFALMAIHGAIISGVGQHYVTGGVVVSLCYARVLWRAVSMFILGTLPVLLTVGFIVAVATQQQRWVSLVILGVLATHLGYLLVAPVVIVEGHRSLGALRRGYSLVRHSEWRVIGNVAVYVLVGIGLSIVLMLPFLLVSIGAAPDATTIVSQAMQVIGGVVVGVVVPPVIFIAVTLLYYDLRVRNENYNLDRLSKEMGLAGA